MTDPITLPEPQWFPSFGALRLMRVPCPRFFEHHRLGFAKSLGPNCWHLMFETDVKRPDLSTQSYGWMPDVGDECPGYQTTEDVRLYVDGFPADPADDICSPGFDVLGEPHKYGYSVIIFRRPTHDELEAFRLAHGGDEMSKLDDLKNLADALDTVGPALRAAREELNLTQAELGRRVPCSPQYLCQIETCVRRPRRRSIRRIIVALETFATNKGECNG